MTAPLRVRDLTIVRGGRTILEEVSFELAAGELVALMGPSGAGKSSLLRAIAGLDPVARGRIEAARVGMVFQFHHLFEHLTVLDNVCLAPVLAHHQPAAEARRRAADLLATLGVAARAAAWPRELSGGEAQRVAIARALAVDPPVLLMDEPTASLDADRRFELLATLRALVASEGRSILVATHDAAVAAGADRVLCLDGGRLTGTRMPAPAPVE